VMNLQVIKGRWFEPADSALAWNPVVIDADAAEALFGNADPIGQVFDKDANPPSRVVGVVAEFRKGGELSGDNNFVFRRTAIGSVKSRPGRNLLVQVKPGVGAQFEETLKQRLAPVAGDWSLEIRSLRDMRSSLQRMQMAPVIIGGIIALFLVLMVAMGLSGVLWQNVTQRHSELGLRRAIGATAAQVRNQILMELALITSIGVLVGIILVAQLPILGFTSMIGLSLPTFITGVLLALSIMFLFTFICGLYPSWLATTIEPADALRAE
jgi:putative ABC transport system permease protein